MIDFEKQKQAVKKVVDRLSSQAKDTTMKLCKYPYVKNVVNVLIPVAVIGGLTIGTLAFSGFDCNKDSEEEVQIPPSSSADMPSFGGSSPTITPINPEEMPQSYEVDLFIDGVSEPLELHYSIDDLDNPDTWVCVYGFDLALNQEVFYLTSDYYNIYDSIDTFSGREVIGKNLIVIEQFGLREALLSGKIEHIEGYRSRVGNGIRNGEFWRDHFLSESFYNFADELSAKYGRGKVYRNNTLEKTTSKIDNETLPTIGTFDHNILDIKDQFIILEIHLWTIAPEYLPDEVVVEVQNENGLICESLSKYREKSISTEKTYVYGYDRSIEKNRIYLVSSSNLKDEKTTDYLTNEEVNCNELTEGFTISLDSLALAAYTNNLVDRGKAKGDKPKVPVAEVVNISPDKKRLQVIFTEEEIIKFGQEISELFWSADVYIPPKNPVLIKMPE